MTSGGKSGRIIQPSIRTRSRPAFHSFAAVAQWQSISLVMRRLWVRFPPAAPQKRASALQMPFFVDSAGCQPASPFGIEMLGAAKTLVRRTCAAGQKAGWVQACPLAGNLKIFRCSGLSLKRARCESCPLVFPLETYCLLHY